MMNECIFCKIITGEIPCVKVYENDDVLAFQALGQVNPGHTLIIPKQHSNNLLEMNSSLGNSMQRAILVVGNAMIQGLQLDGINIINNVHEAAGQEVMHTHIHLIPRKKGDGFKHWPLQETSEEDRLLYAEKIIKSIE